MKIFNKCILALVIMISFMACNKEWVDELYTKMVSFKAPTGNEGVAELYVRYKQNGEVDYNLPVIVSGSQDNDKDLHVKIGVDNDTLGILNQEKYQYRTDLYFKQLPSKFYNLPSAECLIPKGSNTANYKIKFKFSDLDLVEKWVLPLTINDDPSYISNKRKGWRKALLYVKPFNDYSGSYSSTSMNIYFDNENSSPIVMSKKNAWVVDENTVFFYAGMVEERSEERSTYKILMRFGNAVLNADGTKTGTITLSAQNPAINFEVLGQPTYDIKKIPDATLPYLVTEYCTVKIRYKYNDVTSIPNMPIRYRAEGTMTMERRKNTLIPDEDQAIQW